MTTVSETIPTHLQPEVDAALEWFNQTQTEAFEVTGIVDPDPSLARESPRVLRLVLCGGNTCEQRSFRVTTVAEGFDVVGLPDPDDALASESGEDVQAELDPPPGARRTWLAAAIDRHKFVVLVFYRGFW